MSQSINNIPVNDIKGISTAREKLFAQMGIYTVSDLLARYPRAYEYRGNVREIMDVSDSEKVSLVLEITSTVKSARIKSKTSGRMLTVQHVYACDTTGNITITFFNREFLKNTFIKGRKFRFYGVFKRELRGNTMTSPEFEPYYENTPLIPVVPVYSLCAGISQKFMASCVKYALEKYSHLIVDNLSEEIVKKYDFYPAAKAINNIHFPVDSESLEMARRRLAFEELYEFYVKTMLMGERMKKASAYRIKYPDMKAFTNELPFTLTLAQKHAIHDILKDMSCTDKPEKNLLPDLKKIPPARRLVQGDVGCGKTIVAGAVMYAVAKSSYQSALMVPTSILARQHYEELRGLLSKFGIKCTLLTGNMKISEKRLALASIASGETDVVIGTHALIEEDVIFSRLALVITDEQHRFGVMQRKALEEKSKNTLRLPHVVVMSATPIPRTLAMIMYCDLDISIIDTLPKGRQPVQTFAYSDEKRQRVYEFISRLIKSGRQAYIVCPLAEGNEDDELNEKSELKSAKQYCASLSKTVLSDTVVEYIHGKMKQQEKDEIMARFASGKIDILVSTTVIEVGVNVPNAVVMLIENAERFGLSQLHQLRGRVGRGSEKSYCILLSSLYGKAGADTEYAKRMETICKSNSGFVIAQKDLELRGPGEFFGVKQSGEFKLSVANFVSDMDLVMLAKTEAENTIKNMKKEKDLKW